MRESTYGVSFTFIGRWSRHRSTSSRNAVQAGAPPSLPGNGNGDCDADAEAVAAAADDDDDDADADPVCAIGSSRSRKALSIARPLTVFRFCQSGHRNCSGGISAKDAKRRQN